MFKQLITNIIYLRLLLLDYYFLFMNRNISHQCKFVFNMPCFIRCLYFFQINCYFDDQKDYPVTLESLLNIISHLRENFSLDESKSSLLDAVTVAEFVLEKYPSFRFENGKFEPTTEDEIYMAATLLLYFVCVNSKDVNIKSAMCKKLCATDQEIILKFSKCLMLCPVITSSDVLAAITGELLKIFIVMYSM